MKRCVIKYRKCKRKAAHDRKEKEELEVKNKPFCSWKFINKLKPIDKPSVSSRIKIVNENTQELLEKNDVAQYVADYFMKRAHLVSNEKIVDLSDNIPLPCIEGPQPVE